MVNDSDAWHERFLEALRKGASIQYACDASGVGRRTAYDHRKRDDAFAKAWDDAVEAGTDALEDIAWKRAVAHSDNLLIMLLKARRPEKFKERTSIEHLASFDHAGARAELQAKLDRLIAEEEEAEPKALPAPE